MRYKWPPPPLRLHKNEIENYCLNTFSKNPTPTWSIQYLYRSIDYTSVLFPLRYLSKPIWLLNSHEYHIISSTPQFNTRTIPFQPQKSVSSTRQIRQFNRKNCQFNTKKRQFNPKKYRANFVGFFVELTVFWCGTDAYFVLNWQVFLCWTDDFYVLSWGVCLTDLFCVELTVI